MRCKKFNAKQKLKILEEWDGTDRGAKRVARNNLCSVRSIWQWSAAHNQFGFSGLENKSSRPHNYRNPHTAAELASIKSILTEYPGICRQELYYRLQVEKAYARSFRTLYRVLRRINFVPAVVNNQRTRRPTEAPEMPGMKWQIDVKYVPYDSLAPSFHKWHKNMRARLYQYTCIDECTRERFTWITADHSASESVRFMRRSMLYFGYKPLTIQTDNGTEFANVKKNKTKHLFTSFLKSLEIKHITIDPHSPWQNGKVERSHRTDNESFYKYNIFTSLADARAKNKDWIIRYNTMRPSSALGFRTPAQVREQLLFEISQNPSEYNVCRVDASLDRAFAV